jgi:hypothetical protein
MKLEEKKREALLEFLDKKVFNPVLEAIPELYSSERDRRMLNTVKEKVKVDRERFHESYLTAEAIRDQFFREIYFEVRGRIGKALEDLELPRFVQLRAQFIDLCDLLKLQQ